MKIARVQYGQSIFYGIMQGERLQRIEGNIFGDYQITEDYYQLDECKLLAPIDPVNIIAIGLNYKRHAYESGAAIPQNPVIFLKATSSVIGPEDAIIIPDMAPDEVDYEAELAVVIGKKARNVTEEEALDYVLGYTCGNDVSARDCQLKLDVQWARGKSFDTFCPLGPWLETELDPDNCPIRARLNGQVVQDSNTMDMIFSTRRIISYCSRNMTLLPGTVIMTGTPEGVGFARKPPLFLKEGDEIEIEIEGIGRLKNKVRK